MIKTWICIIFYMTPAGSYSPTVATVDRLARLEDCHRIGKSWKTFRNFAGDKESSFAYRYVEVYQK